MLKLCPEKKQQKTSMRGRRGNEGWDGGKNIMKNSNENKGKGKVRSNNSNERAREDDTKTPKTQELNYECNFVLRPKCEKTKVAQMNTNEKKIELRKSIKVGKGTKMYCRKKNVENILIIKQKHTEGI